MTNTDKAWEEIVERVAEIIHKAMRFERVGTTWEWVPGGNSYAQDVARTSAREALQAAGVKELVEAASEANRRYQSTGALIVDNADDKFAMRKLNAALSDKGDR